MAARGVGHVPAGRGPREQLRWLADPQLPPGLVPEGAEPYEIAGQGPLVAESLLADVASRTGRQQAVVVTVCPLKTKRCESVFGYADPKRGAIVVSTAGLGEGETARRRLEAVLAHELGHLRGLRHCRTPGCVMHPASAAEELDRRRLVSCGRCPKRGHWRIAAAAAILLVAFSLAADATVAKLRGRGEAFQWRPEGDGAALLMRGERVAVVKSAEAAQEAARALNELYAALAPPSIELREGASGPELAAGGRTLLRWVDIAEPRSHGQARVLAARLDALIQGKGEMAEGACPACHVASSLLKNPLSSCPLKHFLP